MAENKGSSDRTRQIQVWFTPAAQGRFTGADVCVVDHDGARRLVHRIGSIRLRVGRGDLVGLTPSEVTFRLVDELHTWLLRERAQLDVSLTSDTTLGEATGAPGGATGAAWNRLVNVSLPGL